MSKSNELECWLMPDGSLLRLAHVTVTCTRRSTGIAASAGSALPSRAASL